MLLRMRMRRPALAVALLAGLPTALPTALPAALPATSPVPAQQATPPAQSEAAQSSSQQAPGTAAPAAVPTPAVPSPSGPASALAPKAKEVSVLAIVRDKKGQPVATLGRQDFVLEQDGRAQAITQLEHETPLPLTVGVIADTGTEQHKALSDERKAGADFLNRMLRPGQDRGFVLRFDREVELLQDVTASHEISLQRAIEAAQRSDLLVYCVYVAPQREEDRDSARPSPGPYPGGGYPGGGYPRFPGGGYPGGYPGGPYPGGGYPRGGRRVPEGVPAESKEEGKKVLRQIAEETGGRFFELSKKMNAAKIYAQIEEEMRHQYSLSYTPDAAAGGYHKLHVTTRNPELTVRTRSGYYAANQ